MLNRLPLLLCLLVILAASSASAQLVPPRLTRFVNAQLPPSTVVQDIDVVLWITIDEDGTVSDIEIKAGAGSPWDEAAIGAASQFLFEPAYENGEAIAVRVPFTYRFRAPKRRGRFIAAKRPKRGRERTPGYRYGGTLVEKGTRKPMAAITVEAIPKGSKTIYTGLSDAKGRFVIDGLPPGPVTLRVVTGEHSPIQRKIKARPFGPDVEVPSLVTLYLDPVGVPEYVSVVKDEAPPQAATRVTLSEEELRKTPGTFGDPTRVVASLPGVARSPFGLGYYAVRGASFENTGFFIDGHPALFLYHLLGGPGILHPELVGSIDFYPGGYPVRYGRFATGAIVVKTKNPPADRWHGSIEVDVLKSAALFSIPFDDGKGMVVMSFRRSYFELLLPLVQPDLELSYTDYQFRLTYDFSDKIRTKFVALGSEDSLTNSVSSQNGDSSNSTFSLGFHRLTATVDVDLHEEVTMTNSVSWEYDRTNNERTSEDDDSIRANFSGYQLSIRNGVEWRPTKSLLIEGGFDTLIQQIDVDLEIPAGQPLTDPRPPDFDPVITSTFIPGEYYSWAPFLMADWEIVPGLRLLPGLRGVMDYYRDKARWSIDPRLAVRWDINPEWTLTAMGALAHQPPQPFQYEEPFGADVPQVRGVQGSMGVEWRPGDGWEIKVEAFYNHLFNMPRPSGEVVADGEEGVTRQLWVSDMQGRGYGLEILIRKKFGGRFYGWLSYTLSRSERLRPPEDWVLYQQDQTHILNLAWSVLLGADWQLGARFTLTSGNFYYPVVGSRYDADRDTYEPIYADRTERLPIFHRLDIRLDKRFRFDEWMLEVYLDIQNIYNSPNPEVQRYSYDFRLRTDGPGIPILPTLGVKAVF